MEQTMEDKQVFEVYIKQIGTLLGNQDYEKALALCGEMRSRLLAQEFVDPVIFGWQKYYTFIALIKLGRDVEAMNEFLCGEQHMFIYDYIQTSFMTSVAAEIACSKELPELTLKLCRLAWSTSFHDKEIVMRVQKAQNACIYFERLKQPRLNFSFARFLSGFGKANKIPVLYIQGLECLYSNYKQSHSLTIGAMLLNSIPDVTKLINEKNEDLTPERLTDYIKLVNEIPQKIVISHKYNDALELLRNNDLEKLEKLIAEFPSIVDESDECGMTLLMYAAEYGNRPATELLIKNNADLHRIETISGHTALMIASKQGHEFIIDTLVNNGADPEVKDKFGFTPILMSVTERKTNCLAALLEHGVLMDRRDDDDDTPLITAIRIKNIDAARMLIAAGADISVLDKNQKSIFDIAEASKNEEMIKMLEPLRPQQASK